MQQRIKVLILANTRKKHKEGGTSVEDRQEERASDNSKNFLAHVHVDIPPGVIRWKDLVMSAMNQECRYPLT